MFSLKNELKYSISTPQKELSLVGASRAAKATCFSCPEMKLMLDAGYPTEVVPNILVITHLHWDHIAEVMRVLLSAGKSKNPLIIICPYPSIDYLKNLIEASYQATKRTVPGEPIKYPQHAIIGCKLGDTKEESSIIVDLARKTTNIIGCRDTTIERGKFINYEEGTVNEQLKNMSNPVEILGLRCEHTQIATGYGFTELRHVIKEEYISIDSNGKRKCKFSPEEIKNLRDSGELDDYMEWKRIPLFAFLCDTNHEVFNENNPFNGAWVVEYPVLVIECTFFDEMHLKKAKKDKHMHWNNLEPYVKKYPNIKFKLIHLSERYSLQELEGFRKTVSKYENVEILIDFGEGSKKKTKVYKPRQKPNKQPNKKPSKKPIVKKMSLYEICGGTGGNMQEFKKIKASKASKAVSEIFNVIQSKLMKLETLPEQINYHFSAKDETTNEFTYFNILGNIEFNIKTNTKYYQVKYNVVSSQEFSKSVSNT